MAMKIRLARSGTKKRPFYRIVAADSRMPRDGRFIEKLGTYNPLLPKDSAERVKMSLERINYWMDQGARPTDRVSRFLEAAGVLDKKERGNPEKAKPRKKARERAEANAASEAAASQDAGSEDLRAEDANAAEAPKANAEEAVATDAGAGAQAESANTEEAARAESKGDPEADPADAASPETDASEEPKAE